MQPPHRGAFFQSTFQSRLTSQKYVFTYETISIMGISLHCINVHTNDHLIYFSCNSYILVSRSINRYHRAEGLKGGEESGEKKEEIRYIMDRYKFSMINLSILYGKCVLIKMLNIKKIKNRINKCDYTDIFSSIRLFR